MRKRTRLSIIEGLGADFVRCLLEVPSTQVVFECFDIAHFLGGFPDHWVVRIHGYGP